MARFKKLATIALAAGSMVLLGLTPGDAEARRGWRYRTFRSAPAVRYWSPRASGRYGRAYRPRRYRRGYRGHNYGRYGYGRGVTVGAPGVGVRIGF